MTARQSFEALAVLSLLLLPVVGTAPPCRAQAPAAGADSSEDRVVPEGFGEAISVEVVDVEVRVVDRKGRPITGLDRDDFTLLVDGKPVDVAYFQAVTAEGRGPAEADGAQLEGEPQAAESAAPERHLVIFLDQTHLTTTGRRQLIRDLRPFLEQGLDPRTPVMVASSAGGLRVLQGFTLDREAVLGVLADEERATPGGIRERVGHSRTVRELHEIFEANLDCPTGDPCDCAIPQMISTVRNQAAEVTGRVEDTLSAIETLSAALRGLPGSKTLLLASDGLEFRPGLDLYRLAMDLCPDHQQEISRYVFDIDLLKVYQAVSAHAAANRVTFYTLDTAGLAPANDVTDRPGTRLSQRARDANLQHSLFMLADETGGKAVLNANRFGEELGDVARDIDAYYSLGFTPDHSGADEVHRIEVEVAGDHHDVRYRRAFRHASPDGRMAERMLGTLLFGAGQNPLGVTLSVGEAGGPAAEGAAEGAAEAAAGGADSGAVSVPVRIVVPVSGLVLSPGTDDSVGLVRLYMSVQDVDGEWSPVRTKRVPIRFRSDEEAESAVRQIEVELDVEPGEYLLALGVRDELGGEVSYLRETFSVKGRI